MLEVMSIWRGLLPGCLEKLPGVEQNMAWAAHWFEQAGIRRTILPSARCSHRRDPAIGHQAALQGHVDAQYNLGLMRLGAVVVNVTSRDFLQNIPSFLFQCLLASLSILLDFGWLCYDCSILFSKGFRKAKTVKRGKDLPGGRFWQRKQHCLAALQVLLPRLESGDGVPEETQGSSRKSVWVFSGFDKIIPIFDTSMIT